MEQRLFGEIPGRSVHPRAERDAPVQRTAQMTKPLLTGGRFSSERTSRSSSEGQQSREPGPFTGTPSDVLRAEK
jgi:hypothetical protein